MDDDVTGAAYPVGWEADAVLRDGTTTHIRPIRPSDAPALQAFHVAQSERSTYLRFFAAMATLPERDLVRFTNVDHVERVALVALRTVDDTEHIIGVARYDKIGPDTAEVAFNVADTQQGRGLGSVLLEHVAAAARERGVRRFTAEVLPQNGRMLSVFRDAGYDVSQHVDDGIVTVTVELDPTERSRTVVAERERRAEARSVSALLEARSVVVLVGGPEHEATATQLLAALAPLAASGDVQVVLRPSCDLPLPAGAQRRDDVSAVEGTVDLAVAALDPDALVDAVPDLARHGVRGLVVVSEGYAETGPAGVERQRRLLRTAHLGGMRVVGPGSYGLARTGGDTPLTATLGPVPLAGSIGVFCQSAPTAVTLLATLQRRGLGLSTFLSAGNRADISGNDLMQFWQEDTATTVACLYLESIGNPRKFSRLARRLSAVKPVVVVTAGRSGQVVPPGHVVQATRAPRRTLEEMMRQSGVIRAENTHQMIDIAQLLDTQPLPDGARVAVVASSPALAALVAEASASAGLDVVPTRDGVVPEGWGADAVREAVDAVYDLPGVDAVVAVHIPVLGPGSTAFVQAVAAAAARTARPTVASVLGRHGLVDDLAATTADGARWQVPAYATPEDAVLALAAVVRYAQWREGGHGSYVAPQIDDAAHERAEALAATGPRALETREVAELLAGYGITLVPSRVVADADEAVEAAEALGWPVVVKSTAASLRHRADLGGVRLDIAGAESLREHFAQMEDLMVRQFGTTLPLEVQHQVASGVACVLRSEEDPLFGPVVSFGLAGDAVDLLDDVSYGIPPLTDVDVRAMVRGVRASPRLFGYRGLPPMDVAALEDLVERVSRMADTLPGLRVLELNPVVVTPAGAHVLGARSEVAPASRSGDDRRALPW